MNNDTTKIFTKIHEANIALLQAGLQAIEEDNMELYFRISKMQDATTELWGELWHQAYPTVNEEIQKAGA